MKVHDIVEIQTAQFIFKARKNLLPSQLQCKFLERVGCHTSRAELNFRIPQHRTTKKGFSPTINGIRTWNKLELDLKQCSNTNQFMYKYKLKIFGRYIENELNDH